MALIRYIPVEPRIPFLASRVWTLALGALLVAVSLVSVALQGLNLGVDFRGGILIEIRTHEPADLEDLRSRHAPAIWSSKRRPDQPAAPARRGKRADGRCKRGSCRTG